MVFDSFQKLRDELFPHARELGEMACLGSGFETVDVTDLAGRPDQRHGLRPHARQPQKLKHGGLVLLQQLLAQRYGAGRQQRHDIGCHAFADAGNVQKLFRFGNQRGELRCLLLYRFGGAPVRADAKRIGGVDLEEGGGFVQQAGDRNVVHERALRTAVIARSLSQYATQ